MNYLAVRLMTAHTNFKLNMPKPTWLPHSEVLLILKKTKQKQTWWQPCDNLRYCPVSFHIIQLGKWVVWLLLSTDKAVSADWHPGDNLGTWMLKTHAVSWGHHYRLIFMAATNVTFVFANPITSTEDIMLATVAALLKQSKIWQCLRFGFVSV